MKLLALLVHGIIVMAVLTAERKDLSQADDDSVVKCAKEDAAVLCYGKHQGFSLGSNMLESAWHGAVNLVFTKTGLEQQHNLVKDSSAKTLYGAFIAHEVMATVPAYANPIAYFPRRDPRSKSIKTAGDFVARNAWILQARPEPFFYEHIAVADPAGFHLYAHLGRTWFGNIAFDQFKIAACFANLGDFHFCFHKELSSYPFLSKG